ncbi:MAG: crotonobetainyl-CoA hydratase [Gammaproteobacteria bacterium]|nr:crotonobetainyl-CoA hydratase [Gammaproteobacteria bacterium]
MTHPIRIAGADSVFEITIDRPKANAIDAATSRLMGEAFIRFRDDPAMRCAIVTGGGARIFSAGWDLKAAAEYGENEAADYGPGGFAGLDILLELNKPVIAAVNGIAVGGGVEIALACDMIVAADHATFSLPETALGVMADAGGVQRLPRRIPRNIAMEMLITGRNINAAEATHWGLVNQMVPGDQLMTRARVLARAVVESAPLAVSAIKEVIRETELMSEREALLAVREQKFPIYRQMLRSQDHEEGPRAFAEKRKPVWKGR